MNIESSKILNFRNHFSFVAFLLTSLLFLTICLSSANAQAPGRYTIIDNPTTTTAYSGRGYLTDKLILDGKISFTLSDVLDKKRFDFLLRVNRATTGPAGALKGILIDDHGHYGQGNRQIEIVPLPDGGKRVIFSRIAARTVHFPRPGVDGYWKGFAYITMDFNPFNLLNAMSIDFIRAQPIHNPIFVEGRICDMNPPDRGYFLLRKN